MLMLALTLSLESALGITVGKSKGKKFKISPTHSKVEFEIDYLKISSVTGKFNVYEGSFNFSPQSGKLSNVRASINASSIDTENEKRDNHLRTDDFFAVKKHPKITFVSKSIKHRNNKPVSMTGDITMRGVTKSITLDLKYKGIIEDPWKNKKIFIHAEGKLKRKDFGVNWNKSLDKGGLLIGDEVTINLVIEGVIPKKK